jgi:hypothetical protein
MPRYYPVISKENPTKVADGPPDSIKQHWVNEGYFASYDTVIHSKFAVVNRTECRAFGWTDIRVLLPDRKEMVLVV